MKTQSTQTPKKADLSRKEHLQLIWQVMEKSSMLTSGHVFSIGYLSKLSENGIPTASLEAIGNFLSLSKKAIADHVELDRTTINRRLRDGRLLPRHSSESVLRLLEIENMVSDTFDNANSCEWLHKKHPMLDGATPIEAAKTSYGYQRVKDLLIATKYGGAL